LSQATIWKLISARRLQTSRFGRKRLVMYDSLRSLILDGVEERAP